MKRYGIIFLILLGIVWETGAVNSDSLVYELGQTKQDTVKIDLLDRLGQHFMYTDPDTARHFATRGLELAKKQEKTTEKAHFLKMLGDISDIQGDYQQAEAHYRKAIPLFRQSDQLHSLAHAFLARGLTHIHLGAYPKALEYNQKALTLAREADYDALVPSCHTNIGIIHRHQQNFQQALSYFQQALKGFKAKGAQRNVAKSYGNIGIVFKSQGQYRKALENQRKVRDIYQKMDYTYGLAQAYGNIGSVLNDMNKFTHAIQAFKKSKALFEELGVRNGVALALGNLASVHIEVASEFNNPGHVRHRYQEAIEYSRKELSLAREMSSLERKEQAYKNLYMAHERLNHHQKALDYHQAFKKVQDSLFNKAKSEQISRLETQHQVRQKERKNELLSRENQLQKARIKNNQRLMAAIGVGFAGALAVTFLLLRSRQRERQYNRRLEEKNTQITDQKEELQSFNEKLEEASRFKEAMTRMMVHDLKNPLNYIIHHADAQDERYQNLVRRYSRYMLHIVMNALDVYRTGNDQIQLNTTNFNIYQMVREAISEVEVFSREKQLSLYNKTHNNIWIQADYQILKRVLVNLMGNAIKYTPSGGSITVVSQWDERKLKMSITDTGIGMSKEDQQHLFDLPGLANDQNNSYFSTGLGLYFCKMALEAHQTKIHINSIKEGGTTIWFILPGVQSGEVKRDGERSETSSPVMDFKFTQEEWQKLKAFSDKLKAYEVYEVTSIRRLLQALDDEGSESITAWKEALLQTVKASNDPHYRQLLTLFD